MKNAEVKLGGKYIAKVSNRLCTVRLDEHRPRGGWYATNMRTNKRIVIKSAQRLRGPAHEPKAAKTPLEAVMPHIKAEENRPTPNTVRTNAHSAPTAAEKRAPSPVTATTAKNAPKSPPVRTDARLKGKMSGLDAAARALSEAGTPMNAADIAATAIDKGYWKTTGKTPQATIYAAILREIQKKGEDARFKKTGKGMFASNQ